MPLIQAQGRQKLEDFYEFQVSLIRRFMSLKGKKNPEEFASLMLLLIYIL